MPRRHLASSTVVVVLAVGAAGACAQHMGPRPTGSRNTPRITWVIMHGDRDNPDQAFACQSDPRPDCTIPASRVERLTYSDVHLYFHPTTTSTKYAGVVRVGFFRGSEQAQALKPSLNVKPGDVGSVSVVGIVTDRPGPHTLTIDVTGLTASGAEERLQETIPIAVR